MNLSISITQEQLWGLQFGTQEHNERLPEGGTVLSVEEFTAKVVGEIADIRYHQLITHKEQLALQMFRALPPEQQAALVAQFEIPDVIKG